MFFVFKKPFVLNHIYLSESLSIKLINKFAPQISIICRVLFSVMRKYKNTIKPPKVELYILKNNIPNWMLYLLLIEQIKLTISHKNEIGYYTLIKDLKKMLPEKSIPYNIKLSALLAFSKNQKKLETCFNDYLEYINDLSLSKLLSGDTPNINIYELFKVSSDLITNGYKELAEPLICIMSKRAKDLGDENAKNFLLEINSIKHKIQTNHEKNSSFSVN